MLGVYAPTRVTKQRGGIDPWCTMRSSEEIRQVLFVIIVDNRRTREISTSVLCVRARYHLWQRWKSVIVIYRGSLLAMMLFTQLRRCVTAAEYILRYTRAKRAASTVCIYSTGTLKSATVAILHFMVTYHRIQPQYQEDLKNNINNKRNTRDHGVQTVSL